MEIISLKMEKRLLHDIDDMVKSNRYSTRTEFIREAIRFRLTAAEQEKAIQRLADMKGSWKGKFKLSDEEAGNLAIKDIAKKLNINLD